MLVAPLLEIAPAHLSDHQLDTVIAHLVATLHGLRAYGTRYDELAREVYRDMARLSDERERRRNGR